MVAEIESNQRKLATPSSHLSTSNSFPPDNFVVLAPNFVPLTYAPEEVILYHRIRSPSLYNAPPADFERAVSAILRSPFNATLSPRRSAELSRWLLKIASSMRMKRPGEYPARDL